MEIGVVQAKFQVVHLKHMEYILAAKMRCDKLYIGIIDPDDRHIEDQSEAREEFRQLNPLTYLERYEMLVLALSEFGVRREEFEIFPFPMEQPEYIKQYAPKQAKYFLTICSEYDKKKQEILTGLNLKVEVMWRRSREERGVTGSEIRKKIMDGDEWQSLVPKSTYSYIKEHQIEERMRQIQEDEADTATPEA